MVLTPRDRVFEPLVEANQGIGGAIVREGRLGGALQLRKYSLREDLSEFDAPLIERIDLPDNALRENRMLVERYQSAQRGGSEPFGNNRVGRPIALEDAMGRQPFRCALGANLVLSLSEGESLGLREHVRDQDVL